MLSNLLALAGFNDCIQSSIEDFMGNFRDDLQFFKENVWELSFNV